MFFKNQVLTIYLNFFWIGLFLGLLLLLCKLTIIVCAKNKYVFNFVSFVYVLGSGIAYILLCNKFFFHRFSLYGLICLLSGIIFFSTSVNFFFTKLFELLYNALISQTKKEKTGGKLFSSKKT